jgi:integrase
LSLGDYPPEPLTPGEVKRLLAAADDGTVAGRRNHALLVLLWRTGLRCAEALALRPSDVDTDAGTVRVLRGKGRRARTVGIDDHAVQVLAWWMAERGSLGLNGGPLFCTVRGGDIGRPLDARYIRALMGRLGRAAGVGHRVHAHGLRHTHAVELRKEGWSIPHISRQLGHSSSAVTSLYIDHLHPAEVIDLARRREWD